MQRSHICSVLEILLYSRIRCAICHSTLHATLGARPDAVAATAYDVCKARLVFHSKKWGTKQEESSVRVWGQDEGVSPGNSALEEETETLRQQQRDGKRGHARTRSVPDPPRLFTCLCHFSVVDRAGGSCATQHPVRLTQWPWTSYPPTPAMGGPEEASGRESVGEKGVPATKTKSEIEAVLLKGKLVDKDGERTSRIKRS